MARKGKGGVLPLLLIGGGVFAGIAALASTPARAEPKRKKTSQRALAKTLALRYSKEFGVPESLILAVVKLESDFVAEAENHSPRAERLGGAWGWGQITLEHARNLTRSFPKTAARYWPNWDGTGEGLLDPQINMAMTAFTLWRNWQRYKEVADRWLTAGLAHHQGIGNVDKFIKVHRRPDGRKGVNVDQLPPNGKLYWLRLVKHAESDKDVQTALARDTKAFKDQIT